MKFLTTLTFSLVLMGSAFSQEIDQRLLQRYSQSELETMISSDPEKYKVLEYALDNAIYIIDEPKVKKLDCSSINIEGKDLNIIDLGIEIADQNQYFKIEGQEKLLVVKSNWVLNNEMNK